MFARSMNFVLLAVILTTLVPGLAGAKEKEKTNSDKKPALREPTFKALMETMEVKLDTRDLQAPRRLRELLKEVSGRLAENGFDVPIIVDRAAFMSGNDAATPDPYDQDVFLPEFPTRMKFSQILRQVIAQTGKDATFLFRNGTIEITTMDRVSPKRLLSFAVLARFEKKPFDEVIDVLCDLSGATIVIDSRIGEKARTPVSASFRNNITLEAAVRLLAEMADLHVDIEDNVLFITSKRVAETPKTPKVFPK